VAAAILYSLIAVALIAPALLPGRALSMNDQFAHMAPWAHAFPPDFARPALPADENSDATIALQPLLRYGVDRMPEIPLWNRHIMNGRPLLADAQAAVFSPFTLPAYVLPFMTALAWMAALKWWVAAFGMYLLARSLGMRFGGAFMAGLVYGFSFWMVTWVTFPAAGVWAWIPWMLVAAELVLRRPDLLSVAGLSAVTAAQFLAGHPESSFHAVTATALFVGLRLWTRRPAPSSSRRALVRPLVLCVTGLVGGALLAALTLVPIAELVLGSADLDQRAGTAIDEHLPSEWILAVFMPDYWGRATGTLLEPFQVARAFYAGAMPLMLAAAALILGRGSQRLWIAGFGAISLGVVLGAPPFLQLITRLPIFSSGHNSRLIVYWLLALALLAGWGLDEITSRERHSQRARRLWAAACGALLLVPPVVVLVGGSSLSALGRAIELAWNVFDPPYPDKEDAEAADVIRLASLVVWLTLAGAAAALLVLRRRVGLSAAVFATLVIGLTTLDLLKAGMGYNPAIDRDRATQPATEGIRRLERTKDERFVGQSLSIPENVIPLRYDLLEARGYDLPIIKRYDRLWRTQVEPECPTQVSGVLGPYCIRLALNNVTPRALHALRLLSVKHILQPVTLPRLAVPGVRLTYEGRDARLYDIVGAMPRAWIAPSQQVVPDGKAALRAITDQRFDARRSAITEKRLDSVPDQPGSSTAAGSAQVVRDEDERVVVRVRASRPGVLVLADTFFPGWKAKVDGQDTDVAQVDYVLRGVPVSAGMHTVDFRYEPLSWRVGSIVSLLALAGLAVAVGLGWGRRRAAG
jgi:hypothetical protein